MPRLSQILYDEHLLDDQQAKDLRALIRDIADFPNNVADTKHYETFREHIGEAEPMGPDGVCAHPYLVPNKDKTLCVLAGRSGSLAPNAFLGIALRRLSTPFPAALPRAGRVDIGRHYILTGGNAGLKESYETLVSRLLSFGRYMFDVSEYPVVEGLFASPRFQSAATTVCPKDKQVLDPFQFNFIMQVPGQTVASHIDGVYFWGADRFSYPQWFLAAMKFSGLFDDKFIDQVQVVAYLHEWTDHNNTRGGHFVYWDNEGPPKRVFADFKAGSAVDGSKIVHAAEVYRHEVPVPILEKSAENVLRYKGDDVWHIESNGKLVATYDEDDIRQTIVYRARCFANEEEREHFHNFPEDERMSLEYILGKFTEDLIAKGKLSEERAAEISRIDLALLLMDVYIKYPLPAKPFIPYNYCAASRLMPALEPYLSFICD